MQSLSYLYFLRSGCSFAIVPSYTAKNFLHFEFLILALFFKDIKGTRQGNPGSPGGGPDRLIIIFFFFDGFPKPLSLN